MPRFVVDLWLDGYETEEEMEKACEEFIYDQLNFTASSVRIKKVMSDKEMEEKHICEMHRAMDNTCFVCGNKVKDK